MFDKPVPGAGRLQRRTRRLLSPVVRRLWHIDMHGYERLPADGPAILCPNHISFLDSAFLMLTVPRNISFVGKAEYMDSWKTKYIFPAFRCLPQHWRRTLSAFVGTWEGSVRPGQAVSAPWPTTPDGAYYVDAPWTLTNVKSGSFVLDEVCPQPIVIPQG
jgi:hypothetical protein